MYKENIKIFQKTKRIGNLNIHCENIQSRYKMHHARNQKCQTTHEGVELPNQVVFRTFGEKETYKYLGILEVVTIKQAEMKVEI